MQHLIPLSPVNWKHVSPINCGTERCDPEHSFGPTQREFYLIHYIFSGTGSYVSPAGTSTLAKGDCFIIHPYETTFYKASKDDPWDYAWLGFTCTDPPAVLNRYVMHLPICEHIFSSVASCASLSSGREWYALGLITQLLALMVEADNPNKNDNHRDINRVCFAIETNFSINMTVQELAYSINLDRSYFSKLFKSIVGISPQQYMLQCKLKQAALMLTKQDKTPGEVAQIIGYADVFSFSRSFHRQFGCSPTEFIRREKQQDNEK